MPRRQFRVAVVAARVAGHRGIGRALDAERRDARGVVGHMHVPITAHRPRSGRASCGVHPLSSTCPLSALSIFGIVGDMSGAQESWMRRAPMRLQPADLCWSVPRSLSLTMR